VDFGEKSNISRPKTNWQWTWGRVKGKLAVDLGESQRQTSSGLGGESKTGGPMTNLQWTLGRVKDRWNTNKLAVDLGKSQEQTGSGLGGEVKDRFTKDKLELDFGEKSKRNWQWTWRKSQT
jgi:hypothetical protein